MNAQFICPFCGSTGPLELMGADRFPVLVKYKVIGAGRRHARCPLCYSSDKERLVYTFLKDVEHIENKDNASILHIAPEPNLQKWLNSVSGNYIAGDAFLQNQKFYGDVRFVDICHTSFGDKQFDYIICNHVICDIKDDLTALKEIYRILKDGGLAILQVPITKVSSSIVRLDAQTLEEKQQAYGYGYHERIYSSVDYIHILKMVGFQVKVENISARFPHNGLNPEEDLYLCYK